MSEINKFRKRNVFQKYREIFFRRIFIASKENLEYKTQLYSLFLFDLTLVIIYILFYSVYGGFVSDILNWNQYDFFIFLVLIMLASKFRWAFSLTNFTPFLLKGKLNSYLTKPINSFFMCSMNAITGGTVVTIIMWIFIMIGVLIYSPYNNLIITLVIFIFGTIYYILFLDFFESLSFFIKKNDFLVNMFYHTVFLNEQYTPKMFEGSYLKDFFYILPSAVFGYMCVESLKGNFEIILTYSLALIFIFLFLLITVYLMWHYGLKRYEAFG